MTGNKNTVWIAGTGVLAVLIVVASYFLLLAPKRAQASDTVTQAASVEQSNQTLAAETERLKAQFASIDEQRAQLAQIEAELPDGSQIPALIRLFTVFATGSGVTVTEIAPGKLTEYVSSAAVTADATATAGVASGIQSMPVSVTVEGSFAGTELFIKNIQADMNRYLLVDSVDMTREDDSLSTTISGEIFVLGATAAATTGTASAAAGTSTTDEGAATTTTETTTETSATTGDASTSTGTVN